MAGDRIISLLKLSLFEIGLNCLSSSYAQKVKEWQNARKKFRVGKHFLRAKR